MSLAPILTPGVTVVDMWLGGTAATHCMPLVVLSNGTGWGWHQQLKEWVQMADARRQLTPHTDPMDLRPGDTSRLLDGIRPARGDLLLQPLHDQQLLARRTRAGFEEWLATAGMLGAADSARVALGAYVRQLVLADDLVGGGTGWFAVVLGGQLRVGVLTYESAITGAQHDQPTMVCMSCSLQSSTLCMGSASLGGVGRLHVSILAADALNCCCWSCCG